MPEALVQSLLLAIPALKRQSQEDQKFKLILGDISKFEASLSCKDPCDRERPGGSRLLTLAAGRSTSVAQLCQ